MFGLNVSYTLTVQHYKKKCKSNLHLESAIITGVWLFKAINNDNCIVGLVPMKWDFCASPFHYSHQTSCHRSERTLQSNRGDLSSRMVTSRREKITAPEWAKVLSTYARASQDLTNYIFLIRSLPLTCCDIPTANQNTIMDTIAYHK